MPLTQLTLTKAGDFPTFLNSYQQGKLEGVAVNNDADIDIVAIDTRGMSEYAIQLINSHASNGLIYTLYGTAKDIIPTTYNAKEWEAIAGATATLAAQATKIESVTKAYSFILIRAKRQTSLADSQIDVHLRGEK